MTAPYPWTHRGRARSCGFIALAAVVRERRRRLDLRQEDLADLAGVSLRFVQALEAGKATVQLDRVEAVLVVLGLCLTVEPVPR